MRVSNKREWISSLWHRLSAPSVRYASGALILAGVFFGLFLWGGFSYTLSVSNTESFCISCHEMEDSVYKEMQTSVHYKNRTGVTASCPDCHVPHEWIPKLIRKSQATRELYHKILGTIDTPEKFEKHRLKMALNEIERMKASDSQECRNCHNSQRMDTEKQSKRSVTRHKEATEQRKTCVDCHTGIAHKDVIKESLKAKEETQEADFEMAF